MANFIKPSSAMSNRHMFYPNYVKKGAKIEYVTINNNLRNSITLF